MTRRILFHRTNASWAGGNLVHAQYLKIISEMKNVLAQLYIGPEITSLTGTPWEGLDHLVTRAWQPLEADLLFLAGLDWLALQSFNRVEEQIPVVNLIQHVRHADRNDLRYPFLNRKAVRICVSAEVEQVLRETGKCNGPLVTIPNAVAVPIAPLAENDRNTDIAIAASKQPELAAKLAIALQNEGLSIDVIEPTDRISFLKRLSRSKIAIVLPDYREGFYLPALEAMALGCLVICPDCLGNRSFCISGQTAVIPHSYDFSNLYECIKQALAMPADLRNDMILSGIEMAKNHGAEKFAQSVSTLFADEILVQNART